ncbi:MAG: hypothetical protein ABEJ36_00870 [Candidatus Nanosalina sp.]
MTVETSEPEEFDTYSFLDGETRDEMPRSVHTSVDAKILYLEESDSFEVAITETNAFPEAQEHCESIHEEEWIENTVEALTNTLPEDEQDVVVNLPEHAFDGDHGSLADEKTAIAEGIEDHVGRFETTTGGEDLSVTSETVKLEGEEFDYVLNLSDVGDELNPVLSGPEANSRIVNAPTAIWNTRYPETGKAGLQQAAEEVINGLEVTGVHVPENRSIEYFDEAVDVARDFFEDGDSAVLKGDFGTHGDEVVYLDRGEYENLSEQFRIGLQDYIRSRIHEVEERVRSKKTVGFDYSLFQEEGEKEKFRGRGESETAVIERAVEDGYEVNGKESEVIDHDGRPIDLVFTVWDTGDEYRTGATLRASEKDDTINANCGRENFDLVPYDEAFGDNIYDSSGGPSLKKLMEETSGRKVSREEIMEYAGPVAATALGTRNLSAYRAEQGTEKEENQQIH